MTDCIGPAYYDLYWDVMKHHHTHYKMPGGRGSLKSSFVSIVVTKLMVTHPGVNALVLRKVGETLRDSVYAQYVWAIYQLGLAPAFIFHTSPMEIIYKEYGTRILFRGADKPEKIKSIKVPVGYIGITHFEEKDQFAGRGEIRTILQSTVRGGELFWNFETNNPPISKSNWANEDLMVCPPDTVILQTDYRTAPRAWLGEQFFAEAEKLQATNAQAYEHEYLGVATGTGADVFQNLDIRAITDDEIKEFDRIYSGCDWGYFPDPFAYNRMHYDAARQVLYIYDELTLSRCGNEESARRLKEDKGVAGDDLIIADSAEPKSIADFKSYGLLCKPVHKGPGSVDYSTKWLQARAKIVIDPVRCPDTARECTRYEYERTKDGEIMTGYPDANNHHIDAVRYATYPIWRRRGE